MNAIRLVGVGLLLVCAIGCHKDDAATTTKDRVRVGVVLSLTGPAATYGQECLNGLRLAIDQFNAQQGMQIELVVLDDKGESIETINAVTQLIEVSRADCIIGAVASTNTLGAAKVAHESRVPMLVPISTNADITKVGNSVSRVCFNDEFQGRVLARFAIESLKPKRAVIITDKANDYSIGLAESFRKRFTSLGGRIVGEAAYSAGDADFAALVSRVKALKPDLVFIPGQYADVGAILRQSQGAWDGVSKIGGDGWDSPALLELAGASAIGSHISSHFAADDPSSKVQDFVKAYKERYSGQIPGAMACLGYDTGRVLADASGRVQSEVTREGLLKAIRATRLKGVSGTISFDDHGDAIKDAVILEIKQDGFKFTTRLRP